MNVRSSRLDADDLLGLGHEAVDILPTDCHLDWMTQSLLKYRGEILNGKSMDVNEYYF